MTAIYRAFIASLLVAIPLLAPAGRNVGDALPAETKVAFWVDDLTQLEKDLSANPYLELIYDNESTIGEDPRILTELIRRFPRSSSDPLAPLWDQIFPIAAMTLQFGIQGANSVFYFDAEDVSNTFTNSFALYSTLYDQYVQAGVPIYEWDIIIAADFEESQKPAVEQFLEKALSRVPPRAKKEKLEYSGHEVYRIEYYQDEQLRKEGDPEVSLPEELTQEIPIIIEYAMMENVLLMTEGRGEPLRRAIRALERPDPKFRLNSKDHYRAAKKKLEGIPGGMHVFYDIEHFKAESEDWPRQHRNAYHEMLFSFLGGAASLYSTVSASGDGMTVDVAVAAPENAKPSGVFHILNQSPPLDTNSLRIVPENTDAISAISIDLKAIVDWALMAINPQMSRSMALSSFALGQHEQMIERILDQSSGSVISSIRPGAEDGDIGATFIIPINGSQETVESFNKIIDSLSSQPALILDVQSTDFNGITLWETPVTPVTAGNTLHFAATPAGLMLSSDGAELRAMVRRAAGNANASVLQNDEIRAHIDSLDEENLRGFSIFPAGTMLQEYDLVRKALQGTRLSNLIPARDDLENAVGDTWWSLHSESNLLNFRYRIESPANAQ